MEYNELAAKMLKKRKSSLVFASFAPFRGYSSGLTCSLCNGFGSKPAPGTRIRRNVKRVTTSPMSIHVSSSATSRLPGGGGGEPANGNEDGNRQ